MEFFDYVKIIRADTFYYDDLLFDYKITNK